MTTPASFNPVPSLDRAAATTVAVARSVPAEVAAVGVPVGPRGAVPKMLGVDRATLATLGFEGKAGQAAVVPGEGAATLVAVGTGAVDEVNPATLRVAAAAFAKVAGKADTLATSLADVKGVDPAAAATAVVEGVLLGRYRYGVLKAESPLVPVNALTLVASAAKAKAVEAGARRGEALANAAQLARDLANTPPSHLTANRIAEVAIEVGAARGLEVEVFDEDALREMGCGGILGVNAGSVEPPRMIKLTYRPSGKPTGHLALVGKGVMYDSGGISLKPSDAMHAAMKMDMSGSAAVLSAMSALPALGGSATVTGFMMCTDNMPSGSAMKLGDVLHIHGGTTVEIHNTDAEGRLVLADGLVLATEERPDAIVDIATLTGACVVALGQGYAGVLGTSQPLIDRIGEVATDVDEPVWQLPLDKVRYRKLLDSDVADIKNIGGPYGGSITAAIFLSEFAGDVPWAHIDMAGTMKVDADDAWKPKGATGYGARLLAVLAAGFRPPR
ncbi:MAG: leucyl aminopeptidase [Desertimonas sp.]